MSRSGSYVATSTPTQRLLDDSLPIHGGDGCRKLHERTKYGTSTPHLDIVGGTASIVFTFFPD